MKLERVYAELQSIARLLAFGKRIEALDRVLLAEAIKKHGVRD